MERTILITCLAIGLSLTSCKSEFEKIRASGDVNSIYTKAMGYYEAEEYQKAQTLFELIIGNYRGRQEAEDISFKYAYTYYHLEQYILAAYYFRNFVNTYGTSELREEADFMAAYSSYRMSPTFRLDQTETLKAIDGFQLFVNTYPNSDRVPQCNRLIDEMRLKLELKALESAKLYYDLREYQAAIQAFENVLKDFPDTDNAEQIRYLIVKSDFLLARNSFVEKQEERFQETLKRANLFLTRYDRSLYRNEVENYIKQSEERLKELADVRYQN